MNNPIVSIIIPIYNVAEYLPRCIESVLLQTFKDFELILVDDGSIDNSGAICDEFAKHDNRIKVFHNVNNGAGASRKFGVQHSLGKWIAFVDGDDTIPQESIDELYRIAKKNEHDIIIGTLNLNNQNIFKHQITGCIDQLTYIKSLLLNETSVGPVAKLYKKELFKGIEWKVPKEITNNEDLLMLISLCANVNAVYIDPNIVAYNYLYRNNSASKSVVMPLNYWELLFSYIRHLLEPFWENNLVSKAFYTYELRRLYQTNILKGQFIRVNSHIMSEIRNNLCVHELSAKDRRIFNNVMSHTRQICSYYVHKCYVITRIVLKKCIPR